MEPQTFFLVFLLFTLIAGSIAIFFGILSRVVKTPNPDYEAAIKESLEDDALSSAIDHFKKHMHTQYTCIKCKSKNHEIKEFNHDFLEIFCTACGYKEFYHMDQVAGLSRPKDISFRKSTSTANSKLSSEELKEIRHYSKDDMGPIKSTCEKCMQSGLEKFDLSFDSSYKFGGYGEVKRFLFTLISCPKCGFALFFDRPNPKLVKTGN
ncbi:MAG: hypothetical protein Q8Q33_10295 [Chlamydiota bacterium]|nr:hypothetical protein [Chlamydiota bacterium]